MTSRLAVIAVLLLSWTPVWGQQSPPPFGDTIVVTATNSLFRHGGGDGAAGGPQ